MNVASKIKTTKNLKQPLLPTSWSRRILLVIAVIFCILAGYWLIQQNIILPRQERAAFLDAQDKLDAAVNQIANQPYTKNRWCAEGQEKLGKGPLGCHINFKIPSSSLKEGVSNETVFKTFDNIAGFEKGSYSSRDSFHNYTFGKLVCYIDGRNSPSDEPYYTADCSGNATKVINWIR